MTRNDVISDINKIEDNGTNTALEVRTVLTDLLDFSEEGIKTNTNGIAANSQSITAINTNVTNLTTRVVTLENKVNAHTANISNIEGDINNINDELALLGKPFHFFQNTPITDGEQNLLWYSFQGFYQKSVNFTFKLKMVANETKQMLDHVFELDETLVDILKNILFHFPNEKDRLTFVVSSKNLTREDVEKPYTKIWTTTLDLLLDTDNKKSGIILNFFNSTGSDNDLLVAGDEIFTSIQFHCPEFNFVEKTERKK